MKPGILGLLAAGLFAPMSGHAEFLTANLNGVQIGSQTYNVTFIENSDGVTRFVDLYGIDGGPDLVFTTESDAKSAARSILDAAIVAGIDFAPATPWPNAFVLPFAYSGNQFSYVVAFDYFGGSTAVNGPFTYDKYTRLAGSFAEITPARTPEPGSLALLSLGLAGLGLSRRRRAN